MGMNPFLNAALAALYIVLIVFTIQSITSLEYLHSTLFIPIAMLSLFVLSAAVMGFLFTYKPFQLHFDDRKQEALRFFATTVLTFAGLILIFISYLFFATSP